MQGILGLTESTGICPLGLKDPSSCGEGHGQGRAGAGPYKGPSCLGLKEVLPFWWGLRKEATGGEMDNERGLFCFFMFFKIYVEFPFCFFILRSVPIVREKVGSAMRLRPLG